jgi:hypothetical protein
MAILGDAPRTVDHQPVYCVVVVVVVVDPDALIVGLGVCR